MTGTELKSGIFPMLKRTKQRSNTRVIEGVVLLFISLVIALVSFGNVYAWFSGAFNVDGTSFVTGDIKYSLQSYKSDGSDLTRYVDKEFGSANSLALCEALQRNVGMFPAKDEDKVVEDTWFVIQKLPGSVPLDIRLQFHLLGLDDLAEAYEAGDKTIEYADGFCYHLEEVTTKVAHYLDVDVPFAELNTVKYFADQAAVTSLSYSTATPTDIERALYSYIQENVPNAGLSRPLHKFDEIQRENDSTTLRSNDFCVFHLTVELIDTALETVVYTGRHFDVQLTLLAAQQDGFNTAGTSKTYHVLTQTELQEVMEKYAPGDTIVLDADMEWKGDLVFTRPVALYLNSGGGKKLTVEGNLIFSYPYTDSFLINTEFNGCIVVKKNGNVGGNFQVDLPNSSLVLKGKNNYSDAKTVTEGFLSDFFVEKEVIFNASCIPPDVYDRTSTGYGVTIDKARILRGIGALGENVVNQEIILMQNTQLNLAEGTKVAKVSVSAKDFHGEPNECKRIVIINNGTINTIDISNMVKDTAGEYNAMKCPQIFIDNYSILQTAVILPAWSVKFDTVNYTGNTRIIRELGASDQGIKDGSGFKTEDIEKKTVDMNVIDVDHDGTNLIVYYNDYPNEPYNKNLPASGYPRLDTLITAHINNYTDDGNKDNFNTSSLDQIKKLTIITSDTRYLRTATGDNGDKNTISDYDFIKKMTKLEELDISNARTGAGDSLNVVPGNAFKDMLNLWHVDLPNETIRIGGDVFYNTKVQDVTLPYNCTAFDSNALRHVNGVHITATGTNGSSILNNKQVNTTVNQAAQNTKNGQNRILFVTDPAICSGSNVHMEATNKRGTDFYYRITAQADVEIAAYGGVPLNKEGTQLKDFNFETFEVNGEIYKICAYDNYAFYNKIIASTDAEYLAHGYQITFSDHLFSIGTYCFSGCTGITGTVDIRNCNTLGTYAFNNCTSIEIARGAAAAALPDCCFYGCTSLIQAVFPKAALQYHCFQNCTALRFVESDFFRLPGTGYDGQKSRFFTGTKNVLMMITHTETSSVSDISGLSSLAQYQIAPTDYYTHYGWMMSRSEANPHFRMLISTSTQTPYGYDYYHACIPTYTDNTYASLDHRIPTAEYNPSEFFYVDQEEKVDGKEVCVRESFTVNGVTKYYSSYGYGDYICAWDKKHPGGIAILVCTLKEIKAGYKVPNTLTVDGVSYPVTSVGGYQYVDFNQNPLVFSDNNKDIFESAFWSNTTISGVEFNQIEKIGTLAFYSCTGIKGLANIPNATLIDNYAFAKCSKLEGIRCVPKVASKSNVLTVGRYAFSECSMLRVACFPNGRINTETFRSNTNLYLVETALYASDSSKNFYSDKNMKWWIIHAENLLDESPIAAHYTTLADAAYTGYPYRIISTVAANGKDYYSSLFSSNSYFVPCGQISEYFYESDTTNTITRYSYTDSDGNTKYLSDLGCGDYLYGIENGGVTLVAAFLTSIDGTITFPAVTDPSGNSLSLKKIGDSSFRQVTFGSSAELILPNTCEEIGTYAFYQKSTIKKVDAPKVKTIGAYAFYQDSALLEINMPKVETLGSNALNSCSKLRIAASDELTTIGTNALDNCTGLALIRFPKLRVYSGQMFDRRSFTNLVVMELGICESSGTLLNSLTNVRLLILHPETSPLTDSSKGWFPGYWNCFPSTLTSILISDVPQNSIKWGTKLLTDDRINTGNYGSSDYRYADVPAGLTGVTRTTWKDADGNVKYLSDLGYGDYVYVLDANKNATLLVSTLNSITGDYTTPDSFTYIDGGTQKTAKVTKIGDRAFQQTQIPNKMTLTIANGTEELGARAFRTTAAKKIAAIDIAPTVHTIGKECFNNLRSVTETLKIRNPNIMLENLGDNLFSQWQDFKSSDLLKVYVPTQVLKQYKNSTYWRNIPTTRFYSLDVIYQDVDSDGKCVDYVIGNRGDNTFMLGSFSGNITPTLTIPSIVTDNSTSSTGPIVGFATTVFSSQMDNAVLQTIVLPDQLQYFDTVNTPIPAIAAFQISPDNPYFETEDGVLYTKGKKVLLLYPAGKTDTSFTIPASVVMIAPKAFNGNTYLQTLTAATPSTNYLVIPENAFVNCTALTSATFCNVVLMKNSFTGCKALTSVDIEGDLPTQYVGPNVFGDAPVNKDTKFKEQCLA